MNASAVSAHAKALEAWGEDCPEWVIELAKACDRSSQNKVAERIGYSGPAVSRVIHNDWNNYDGIKKAVEGVFLQKTVICPIVGELKSNVCLENQKRDFSIANRVRIRLYHACRNGCPNSRLGD